MNYTYGGLGSSDEMCINALVYYPKENGLQFCIDSRDNIFGCIKNTLS